MPAQEAPPDGQASVSDFDFFEDVDSEDPIPVNQLLSTATPPIGPQHRRLEQLRGSGPASSTRANRSGLKRPQETAPDLTPSTKKAKKVTIVKQKWPIVLDDSEDDHDPSTDEEDEADEIPPAERLQTLEVLSAADTASVYILLFL